MSTREQRAETRAWKARARASRARVQAAGAGAGRHTWWYERQAAVHERAADRQDEVAVLQRAARAQLRAIRGQRDGSR